MTICATEPTFAEECFGSPELMKQVFTEGDCWVLAEELYHAFGWTLVLVGNFGDGDNPADCWEHACVRRPDGMLVDITGSLPDSKMIALWSYNRSGYMTVDVTTEQFARAVKGMTPEWEQSRGVAKEWIARTLTNGFQPTS